MYASIYMFSMHHYYYTHVILNQHCAVHIWCPFIACTPIIRYIQKHVLDHILLLIHTLFRTRIIQYISSDQIHVCRILCAYRVVTICMFLYCSEHVYTVLSVLLYMHHGPIGNKVLHMCLLSQTPYGG